MKLKKPPTSSQSPILFRIRHAKLQDVLFSQKVEKSRFLDQRINRRILPIKSPLVAAKFVEDLLKTPDSNIIQSSNGIDFCTKDLYSLVSPNWLNDEVINFYLHLITERSLHKYETRVYVFSTFFYAKIKSKGYDSVRKTTLKCFDSILNSDLLLIPIHLGMHWCLVAVDNHKQTISYYDSLKGENMPCLKHILDWLSSAYSDFCPEDKNLKKWKLVLPKFIPAQVNGFDCGVFVLVMAEHLSRNVPFSFDQNSMPYWRKKISYEIATGKLIDA